MKKKKLKLNDLKIKSFTTSIQKPEEMKGGRTRTKGAGACPHLGEPTMDYLGCNSLDDFYCQAQSVDHPACVVDPSHQGTIGGSVFGEF